MERSKTTPSSITTTILERSKTAPYDIENPSIQIATSIIEELDSLSSITSGTSNCSIYRVPQRLRSMNEKAYTPRVVSIGPFHHGNQGLQVMEEQKKRYLQSFLRRTNIDFLEHYINKVRGAEKRLRSCYADTMDDLTSDEFVRIIVVDAIFIIELLLRYSRDDDFSRDNDVENDHILHAPGMIIDVWPDMLMLENQLPFFILQDLLNLHSLETPPGESSSDLFSLSLVFFTDILQTMGENENLTTKSPSFRLKAGLAAHFLDFVRLFCLPVGAEDSIPDWKSQSTTLPCISQLHRAGVNFKVGSTKNLFDIRFVRGTLEIPKLEISDVTVIIIRNLIALEECHYPWNNMISNYALTMDRFVNTSKDVELLVEHGIFENMLRDDSEVATMINSLSSGVFAGGYDVYYGNLYKDVNAHCKKPWNIWKANLIQIYFNTPWTTMKVIAAVLLLILTLIQTVCSIMSLT